MRRAPNHALELLVRTFKIILILFGLAFAAVFFLFYFNLGPGSPYHRFHNRDANYYSGLAHACDRILQQHPHFSQHKEASTKQGERIPMWMDANDVLWDQTRLSLNDPSLPDAVRRLRPDKIYLTPRRVFIGFGVGRGAWAIIWEQDEMQTNQWTLHSNAEGLVKTVYVETK